MLVLLSRQMQRSRTPSGISRLSFWTFLVQCTVDSLSFAGHTIFALLADGKPSLSLIVPAFLACVLFANEVVRFHEVPFFNVAFDTCIFPAICYADPAVSST